MTNHKRTDKITIACAGCGRTQALRVTKVIRCDYYTCGAGNCKLNPGFQHPETPEGFIHVEEMNAAGGFTGHKIRPPTIEEWQSVRRAKALLDAALRQRNQEL